MGYTHYFCQSYNCSADAWHEITRRFRQVVNALPESSKSAGGVYTDELLTLGLEWGRETSNLCVGRHEYKANKDLIAFNGVNGLGHEDMALQRRMIPASANPQWAFCKTARKPYDLAVCSLLLIAHTVDPDCWFVSSDGDRGDWQPAIELVESVSPEPVLVPDFD